MNKLILCFTLFFCVSCQFVGTIYNVGSKVGAVVMDERELADDWNDTKINMAIRTSFLKDKINYVLDVEITVFEGEVLLNGAIPTIEDLDRIVQIAWETKGVLKVYNYIRVDKPSDLATTTKDAFIASSIRTKLTMIPGITSVNYKITVDKGVLYMMGIAKDASEFQAVMNVIYDTEGIERVISHVRKSYEN